MKKIFYLILVSMLISCSSKTHYTVKGKIAGSDSITFYLQMRDAGKTVSIDSAISRKGSFTLEGGAVDYPRLVQLVAGNTRKRTSFYLENSDIIISGSLDSLYKARVAGSHTQDEYMSLIDSNKSLSEIYSKIITKYQAAIQTGEPDKIKALRSSIDSIQTEMLNLQKNFVKNNPSSYVSPSLLMSLSIDMDADEIEMYFNGLDSSLKILPEMNGLKEKIAVMKTVAVGQKAPDFTMNDVNGKPVVLSSKVGTKLLLLDFWAAWCNPCRQENPNIVKVYNEFHKKGFDIIGVSLDNSKEAWLNAISDDKLIWTQVSDLQRGNNAAAKLYSVNSIPSNFLLDDKGVIIARNLRGEHLHNKVKEVLGAK